MMKKSNSNEDNVCMSGHESTSEKLDSFYGAYTSRRLRTSR